jgi:hypothetical protein
MASVSTQAPATRCISGGASRPRDSFGKDDHAAHTAKSAFQNRVVSRLGKS